MIAERSREATIVSAVLVFLTPLVACTATLLPFLLVYLGVLSVQRSIYAAILVDLALIFLSGLVFGGERRLWKGVRMTVLGVLVFLVGFTLNRMM